MIDGTEKPKIPSNYQTECSIIIAKIQYMYHLMFDDNVIIIDAI